MRALTKRRQRRPDPLASTEAVRGVLARLRAAMPEIVPTEEERVTKMLRAARHLERYSATDSKRGKRPAFERALLLRVASTVRLILEQDFAGRISLASFVDHYLNLLTFPADVTTALSRGDINLFEAELLARLTPKRLGTSAAEATKKRRALLEAHVGARLSGTRLRLRVNEILGLTVAPIQRQSKKKIVEPAVSDAPASEPAPPTAASPAASVVSATDIEAEIFEDYDATEFLYDELRRLVYALREYLPEDFEGGLLDEYLNASEPLWAVLDKVDKRKKARERAAAEAQKKKFPV